VAARGDFHGHTRGLLPGHGQARLATEIPLSTREGMTCRTALHEVAHLQADIYGRTGHRWAWAASSFGLLERWMPPDVGRTWKVNWFYALDKAEADKTLLAPRKGTGRKGHD
jgi:hypothetical protein